RHDEPPLSAIDHGDVVERVETRFVHLLNPHGLGSHDLETDAIAIEVAAGTKAGLLNQGVERFQADPWLRFPTENRLRSKRAQRQLLEKAGDRIDGHADALERLGVAEHAARVEVQMPLVEERRPETGAHVLAAHGSTRAERWNERPEIADVEA